MCLSKDKEIKSRPLPTSGRNVKLLLKQAEYVSEWAPPPPNLCPHKLLHIVNTNNESNKDFNENCNINVGEEILNVFRKLVMPYYTLVNYNLRSSLRAKVYL